MLIEIREGSFEPWQEIKTYQDNILSSCATGKYGASNVFVGTMRDFNQQQNVSEMFLEYYPGMTEKQLTKICEQSLAVEGVVDILLIHRVGKILPDESIVLVAVWSAHRKAAFEQCRNIMEDLKTQAPFWKKETTKDGTVHWVDKNTAGY